ncbi:MAG: hypothetical protein C0401_12530 [Anaerolinea sp.]|nr:hypothetical protein [Anaerolinea sp.]
MPDNQYKHDVAISFLSQDEPIALDLHSRLSLNFNVFVYSKKQEELAGSEGIETFRKAFRSESRMVVVLYRDGWGSTPWTRIEEGAITDRFLKEGWNWLLFIMLDSKSTPPPWLPETRIRLYLEDYGIEQAVGAIKVRLQEIGSQIQKETALKRAKIIEGQIAFRAEKEKLFSSNEGVKIFENEFSIINQEILKIVDEISKDIKGIDIQCGSDRNHCVVTSGLVSIAVNWRPRYANDLHDSPLKILEFNGRILLPNERGRFMVAFDPIKLSFYEFEPDMTSDMKGGWRAKFRDRRYFTSIELADFAMKVLLNLIDRSDKGEIPPIDNTF